MLYLSNVCEVYDRVYNPVSNIFNAFALNLYIFLEC